MPLGLARGLPGGGDLRAPRASNGGIASQVTLVSLAANATCAQKAYVRAFGKLRAASHEGAPVERKGLVESIEGFDELTKPVLELLRHKAPSANRLHAHITHRFLDTEVLEAPLGEANKAKPHRGALCPNPKGANGRTPERVNH